MESRHDMLRQAVEIVSINRLQVCLQSVQKVFSGRGVLIGVLLNSSPADLLCASIGHVCNFDCQHFDTIGCFIEVGLLEIKGHSARTAASRCSKPRLSMLER